MAVHFTAGEVGSETFPPVSVMLNFSMANVALYVPLLMAEGFLAGFL
jgi:hypothetical protein